VDTARFAAGAPGQLVRVRGHDAYLDQDYDHFAFVPRPLPAAADLTPRTYKLISEAERAVGRLDAGAGRLPNPSLLTRPALRREAQSTAALEGTYAPLHAVLEGDYVEEHRRTAEVREVLNYVAAAERGLDLIKERPICLNLIAELQSMIVRGTRGDGYDAGRLRTGQVYIGERERGIEASRFVPPPAGDELVRGVSDWEKWINADDDVPLMAKAALGHYQFETLHPFRDGNGRLGRLIVTLQLVDAGALRYPILNLSPWLKAHEDEYKDGLLAVSRSGSFDEWVQFFCQAVIAQAYDGIGRIDELLTIRTEFIEVLRRDKAKGVVMEIVEDLIGYPVITPTEAASLHNVTYPPANNAISRMVRLGILQEATGRNYGRIYVCPRVMRVVERP
jgi:Fic family protein